MTQGSPLELSDTLTPPTNLNVTAPRPFIFDYLLLFGSMGIYAPFLLAGNVRDIKKITGEALTPWLWIFVPFFGIVQAFALPKLNKQLTRIERQLELPSWQTRYQWWTAAIIIISFYYGALGSIEDASILLVLAVGLTHFSLFSLITLRIRRIKQHAPNVQNAEGLKKYNWWEWPIVVLGSIIIILFSIALITDETANNTLKKWPAGSVFTDPETGLTFPINNIAWKQLENEPDSDALFLFEGPNSEFTAYIFDYTDRSVNNIAENRYIEALEENDKIQCTEKQTFRDGALTIRAEQACFDEGLLGVNGLFSTLIETPDRTFEFYVELYSSQKMNSKMVKSVQAATAGFTIK